MQKKKASFGRRCVQLLFFVMPVLPCLAACSAERTVQLTHLRGVLAWKQQDWNEAVLYFFEAGECAAEMPQPEIKQYADFALASAYLMQGEHKAAQEKLDTIPETAAERLRSQRFYQQGVIAFQVKDYSGAAALFKKSLELCSTDIDAKINYELSKQFYAREAEARQGAPQAAAEYPQSDGGEDSIILDIIRKREQAEWKKMQYEAEPAINDY